MYKFIISMFLAASLLIGCTIKSNTGIEMDNAIVVLAIIEAKSNSIEKIKEEALKIVPLTLKEPGCITYQLHQDTDSPKTFTFYEVWENQKSLDAHNQSEHLQSFIKNIDGNTENITLKTMNIINDIH